ncbi:uncharacterized protein J3R85_015610 [Psidium guajava]|nr:uncharacterized protein J3R85_015610 [Psidium guajava]
MSSTRDDMNELLSKVVLWEESTRALLTNLEKDVKRAESKLGELEHLMQEYRKFKEAKSSSKHQQQEKTVQPLIISKDLELAKDRLIKNHLMKNLRLSYHNMGSPQLKMCFLSLAVFPWNSIIKKRSLVYWWIGEGLVSKSSDKTAEEVGEEVYDKLIKQGLIEPDDDGRSPLMNRCKIHPCIRYMLISLAQEAGLFYFSSKDETSPEVLHKSPLSSSRLRLLGEENSLPYREAVKDEDVSTVFNVNKKYLSLPHAWLLKMKKLAVLQLGRWLHSPIHHIEVDDQRFLDDLGVLHKHLKFLSLRGISRNTTLPDSIVKIDSLEILDLRACHNLEKLPEDIGSLKKLTHLDISECYLIDRMPKGTEKLSSLQVLKGFVVGTARRNPCKISDLKNLTKLRRLSIYIGRGAPTTGVKFASLKDVESLCSLTISWRVTSSAPHAKAVADWDLPQHLEKLELIGMPEERMPDWKNVKKLYVIGGKVASLDPPQQINSSVEILRLKHLRELRIGNREDVLKKFPQLVYFERANCAGGNMWWYKSSEVKKGV